MNSRKKPEKKHYAIDTNVLLDNQKSVEILRNGSDNDIYLPHTVLMELDKLKSEKRVGHLVSRAINEILDLDYIKILRCSSKVGYGGCDNMGMRIFGSRCSCNTVETKIVEKFIPQPPNPDPSRFSIIESKQIRTYLILKIKYHDCTNYEGVKILVFEDMSDDLLFMKKEIDPHFCENCNSPIARFEPTERGWEMAKTFVNSLIGKQ